MSTVEKNREASRVASALINRGALPERSRLAALRNTRAQLDRREKHKGRAALAAPTATRPPAAVADLPDGRVRRAAVGFMRAGIGERRAVALATRACVLAALKS